MNNLSIILSANDGGMKFITGGLSALFVWGIIALFNYLKSKVQSVATDISLKTDSNNVRTLIKKGSFEMSKNRYDSAIDYLHRAIELSSDNGEALALIAMAYHIKKDYINSKKHIELWEATKCDKDYSSIAIMTYLNGHHYYMEGKAEQAQNCKMSAMDIANQLSIISDDAKEIINKLNLY
jgi:tetratricopeptide (TPR) repeat protein